MKDTSANRSAQSQTLVLAHEADGGILRVRKTKLLVISGPLQGQEFVVGKEVFTIGSGKQNDLVLDDSTASRRHCEIEVGEGGYQIRDLDSTNGTLVDGVRVTSTTRLPDDATLTLGGVTARMVLV